jgi:hypothetical protein
MKKTILLGCMLIIAISCKAQQIVPLEKKIEYKLTGGIPDGVYLKDINNLLGKYMGTWKGTIEGKNYTFIITKFKDDYLGISVDKLLIRYLITTTNGTILEDTRNLPTTSPYVIEGDYFSKGATYYVSNYFGKNSICGNQGTVFIRMKNTANTEMSVTSVPDKMMISEENCPGLKLAEQVLPAGMRLTKQ